MQHTASFRCIIFLVFIMKRFVLFPFFIVCSLLIGTLLAFSSNPKIEIVNGKTNNFVLRLDSSQKIEESDSPAISEFTRNVNTSYHNQISISAFNVINNENGWETLLPEGYFYNPVTLDGDNNKISGISSFRYIGDGSLELHYGYSLNNEEIIYSFSETLVNNETYYLNDNHPSYFYIKNNNEISVSIDEFIITYSCEEESFPLNNLKVLMIGNSFADDTIYYGERIAGGFGISLDLYDAYIGGCTINTHYTNLLSDNKVYSMRSMNGENWVYKDNMSLRDIILSNTFDIITFQQASAEVGRNNTYSNLTNLVNEVKSIALGNPKYYWHQTWAYDKDYSEYYDYFSYFNNDQETMFNAIVDCYLNEVVPTNLFEKTIFNGTAVQNLRTSYMKDTFSRDGKHMSLVHGRYLLGANFISSIYGIDYELSPLNYRPIGLNKTYLDLVNESIKNARNNPNVITESKYTQSEIKDYDLSNFTEIDAGIVGCSYYYSQDPNNYNMRNNHVENTSNVYASTFRFTRDTLPVGSIVFIQEGLGYRPEAWINDSAQSFRKGEEYKNVLEITEEFWDGYMYRAFNIFKAGKQKLSDQYVDEQYDDIFDGFRIFVPNEKMTGLTPKSNNPSYASDSSLFSANGLNIDNYTRVHLDPITGFYKCDSYYYLMNSYLDSTAQKFVCTRPFYKYNNDLPVNSVIIVDSSYQYRSDCWGEKATYSPRPNNVTTNFSVVNDSFINPFRRRTFNISNTNSSLVGQNSIDFMNHFRIYIPKN